jgi:hypothetical protein
MTTVTVYRSTDASAPSLTGQVGSLVTLLLGCLVNGYGSQSAAGWTNPYNSGGNKAVFRNSAVDGTGLYLNVDDNGTTTAKEAYMTGFETMSAFNTGTNQFPTSGQLNIGSNPAGALVCRKSTTADGTARAWTVIADDTVFYLFTETGDQASPTAAFPFVFGDIFSYKSSDAYRCIIIGRNASNTASPNNEGLSALLSTGTGSTSPYGLLAATIAGHYMDRTWTGVGGSVIVGKHADQLKLGCGQGAAGTGTSGSSANSTGASFSLGRINSPSFFPYPNGPDGGLYLSPIWIHHSSSVRGYLKGLWCPLHDRPLNHNDTYSGTGNLNGKSFVVQAITATVNSATDVAQVHIETSSTWS